jgi:hypothetical protein
MARQSKAVKQQAAACQDTLQALRTDAAAWKAKLLGYERLLGAAMSLKGVDICWREAQALRSKLEKQLEQRVEAAAAGIVAGCAAVVAANREFEAAHLKSFAGVCRSVQWLEGCTVFRYLGSVVNAGGIAVGGLHGGVRYMGLLAFACVWWGAAHLHAELLPQS